MSRLRSAALGAAILFAVCAGPAALLALFFLRRGDWLASLKDYQTLAGGLAALFAAGLATMGVWMNVTVQRDNSARQHAATREQIEAQRQSTSEQLQAAERQAAVERDEQRRIVAWERHTALQQLASSFAGEIVAVVHVLRLRLPKTILTQSAALVKQGWQQDLKLRLAIKFDLRPVYDANVGNLGLLPVPMPERLAAFYGYLATFINDLEKFDSLDQLDSAAREGFALKLEGMEKELDRLIKLGEELYTSLSGVLDELFLWPPAPARLRPGQIATLGEILEKELTPDEQALLFATGAPTSEWIENLMKSRSAKRPHGS